MRWAFEIDTFWPRQLIRPADPLGYFERKLAEQIMSRYLGWKTSKVNESKTRTKKEGNNHDKQQPRSGAQRATGKQPVDNAAAAEEAKRRIAERLGS
jgi:hypothetical protein